MKMSENIRQLADYQLQIASQTFDSLWQAKDCRRSLKHFRLISTARLKALRLLHLQPICGVVFPEPFILPCGRTTKPNLEDGFALICLQRLS
jgi:hypothetical protein